MLEYLSKKVVSFKTDFNASDLIKHVNCQKKKIKRRQISGIFLKSVLKLVSAARLIQPFFVK